MTLRIALAMSLITALFTGCLTRTKPDVVAPSFVDAALTKLLPADFSGPARVVHRNQYFDLTIEAEGLTRGADGRWTFTWLEYERTSHFPLFSGLTWSSTGKVTLGKKPGA